MTSDAQNLSQVSNPQVAGTMHEASGGDAAREIIVGDGNASQDDIGSRLCLELHMPSLSESNNMQPEQFETNQEGSQLMDAEIIVAVMGVTGAGKSTFISLLSGQDIQINHGQRSCTMNVGAYHFELNGVRIWLIDTPGFDDSDHSDSAVLKDIATWLAEIYTNKKVHLAGIIYLHRITEVRMQGSALRNLRLFSQLCGMNNLKSVILATTHWTHREGNSVPESVGQARVKELEETKEFWGGMIERGSRVEKHDGSKASATRIVSDLVSRNENVTLNIQRQLVDEKKNFLDTDAGQTLQREFIEERKRSEVYLAELKLDMQSALLDKDKKWQEQIQQDKIDLEKRIKKGTRETEELKIDLSRMGREKSAQMRALEKRLEAAMKEIEDFRAAKQLTRPMQYPQSLAVAPYRHAAPTSRPESPDIDLERHQKRRTQSKHEETERRQPPQVQRTPLSHRGAPLPRSESPDTNEGATRPYTSRQELERREPRHLQQPGTIVPSQPTASRLTSAVSKADPERQHASRSERRYERFGQRQPHQTAIVVHARHTASLPMSVSSKTARERQKERQQTLRAEEYERAERRQPTQVGSGAYSGYATRHSMPQYQQDDRHSKSQYPQISQSLSSRQVSRRVNHESDESDESDGSEDNSMHRTQSAARSSSLVKTADRHARDYRHGLDTLSSEDEYVGHRRHATQLTSNRPRR